MKSVAALMDPTDSQCHMTRSTHHQKETTLNRRGEDTHQEIKWSYWTLHLFFKIISIQINNLGNK